FQLSGGDASNCRLAQYCAQILRVQASVENESDQRLQQLHEGFSSNDAYIVVIYPRTQFGFVGWHFFNDPEIAMSAMASCATRFRGGLIVDRLIGLIAHEFSRWIYRSSSKYTLKLNC
ncbi:MAG: hypothetical protein WBF21_11765, partial [Steroidobacteraceae bacterium]